MPDVVVPEWFNATSYFVDRNLEQGRGDNLAILSGDQELTYRRVAEQVNRTGNMLRGLGVEMENRVMLVMLDSPELAYCFFGAMKIGAVPIPTNTLLKGEDYAYLLDDSRAKVLVVSKELYPTLEPILKDRPYLRQVLVAGNVPGRQSFDQAIEGCSAELEAVRTHKDDVAFWLYSSGSTGPRGLPSTCSTTWLCAELYAKNILGIPRPTAPSRPPSSSSPMAWATASTSPSPSAASAVLFPAAPAPDAVFEVITSTARRSFSACPRSTPACSRRRRGAQRYDMSALRRLRLGGRGAARRASTSAGATASASRSWTASAPPRCCTSSSPTGPGAVRPGTTRQAGAGLRAAHRRRRRRSRCRTARSATCWSRADSTCAYYWNKHERTKRHARAVDREPATSIRSDADGYYWYAGRTDDMLKVGGIWVSPVEVEAALIEHPAVLEAAVVGARGRRRPGQAQGLRGAQGRPTAGDALAEELQAVRARTRSRPTSTRAGSSSSPSCRRRRPARSSASSCGRRTPGASMTKRLSMREAVERYVPDGSSMVLGAALGALIPFAPATRSSARASAT